MRILAIVFLLSLAACATPEQRAEQLAADITENYGPLCTKLGYQPGSESHRDCMVSMYNADQVRNAIPWGRFRR